MSILPIHYLTVLLPRSLYYAIRIRYTGGSDMQLISYKDDAGETYWLTYDCNASDRAAEDELKEIAEKGWDVEVRIGDIDMEELASLRYFLDQYLKG
jgi:hypothetical protein